MIGDKIFSTSIPVPISAQFEKIITKMTTFESSKAKTEDEVKKAIFDILPKLKLIFRQTGIPLIEIRREINCDFTIVVKVIKQMIAKGEIMGFLDHRQTVGDLTDDILYLESEPSFQCEICKNNQERKNPHYQCKRCERNICENCYTHLYLLYTFISTDS